MKLIFMMMCFLSFITMAKEYKVQILNSNNGQTMVFEPSFLQIEVGDKVTFVPTDPGHNSTSVFAPSEAKGWKGDDGEKLSVSFDKEGVYIYECTNHAIMGMIGFIQVGKSHNLVEAKKFYDEFKKKFVMNKERYDKVLNR